MAHILEKNCFVQEHLPDNVVSPRMNTGPYFLIFTPSNVVLYVCMVILVMFVESIRFYYVSDNLSDNGLLVSG